MSYKSIVLTPVKNEGRILDLFLSCVSMRADYIIIADQNSTDNTFYICKKYPKVIYIKNEHKGLNMSIARQLLLDEARKIPGENMLFCLDADEILSGNVINNKDFEHCLVHLKSGQSIQLQWIMLRGNINHYRDDNFIWGNIWKHFIFMDDRKYNFNLTVTTSEPRMPEDYMKDSMILKHIKNLHFQFIDIPRMLSKQRRYRVHDFLNSTSKSFLTIIEINMMYFITKYNYNFHLSKTPKEWLNNYEITIKDHDFDNKKGYYWYEKDTLEVFKQYGTYKFRWLDIRDINRNEVAKKAVINGDFTDPRNRIIKIYHKCQFLLEKIRGIVPQWVKKILARKLK